MSSPADRLALVRGKVVRSLQLLDQAKKMERISEQRYQKLHQRYIDRLKELGEKSEDQSSFVHANLELPAEVEKKSEADTGKSNDLLGGVFVKIGLAVLVFIFIGFFIQYAKKSSLEFMTIAFACPLLYLFIAYLIDHYEPEPKMFVLGAFFWGMLSTVLAAWINTRLLTFISFPVLVCLAGVTEELVKGVGVYKLSRHPEYNDPLDGLLYGIAVGLGFAAVENVMYFIKFSQLYEASHWTAQKLFLSVGLRSTLSALGHAAFTGMLSLILARAKLKKGMPDIKDFFIAYLVGALIHGMFNGMLLFIPGAPIIVGVLIIGCFYYFWSVVKDSWKQRTNMQLQVSG